MGQESSRTTNLGNKENVSPPKRINAFDRGYGHRSEEKNKDASWKPIECWSCGKDHCMRYCPQNKGGRPQIYSA